ncbi:MAG: extracellular solute-binding protein [Clostridia bacterium]|nr:extracellular solute-binding protein [Clostridia bacterium]
MYRNRTMSKRFLICFLLLTVIFLAACEQKPEYRKEIAPWQPTTIEGGITVVSSPHLYTKNQMENPGKYFLGSSIESQISFRGGNLIIATGNFQATGQSGITLLEYGADGTLRSETAVPDLDDKMARVIDVYATSDGRFVYYCLCANQYDTFLRIADANGTVLYEIDLPKQEVDCFAAATSGLMGMHVSEQENGELRIFVNAWYEAYYFDETLSLLQSVSLPTEYENIHMESDGVYVIGQEMPGIGRVDMNVGTFEAFDHEDLPIPPSMIYGSKIHYSAEGKMYCAYEKVLYRCDGDGTITEIMRWVEGSETGNGILWIMNDTSVYYLPNPTIISEPTMVRLDIRENDLLEDRQVLILANLCSGENPWLAEMIGQFNAQSTDYFVHLKQYGRDGDNALKEDILSGNIPDLVTSQFWFDLTTYFDKGIFLDLSQEYGDMLLSGVTQSFLHKGALYNMPLSFYLDTFVSLSETQNEPLTWERIYALEDSLQDGEVLHNSYSATYNIGDHIASSFYDADAKTASFDSDAYRRRVEFMKRFSSENMNTAYGDISCADITGNRYVLSAPYILDGLDCGAVKLMGMPIRKIEAFSALKLLFGEREYTICGYPSDDGIGAHVVGTHFLSIAADSDYMAGCAAFAEYLLSDDAQCHDAVLAMSLPVTRSAMSRAIDAHRYFYYGDTVFQAEQSSMIGGHVSVNLNLSANAHTAEYDARRAETAAAVIEITDDDKAEIMHFFENFRTENTDETIAKIVKEELSAWESGAKSLDEVSKLIQSRAWIYLNE